MLETNSLNYVNTFIRIINYFLKIKCSIFHNEIGAPENWIYALACPDALKQ